MPPSEAVATTEVAPDTTTVTTEESTSLLGGTQEPETKLVETAGSEEGTAAGNTGGAAESVKTDESNAAAGEGDTKSGDYTDFTAPEGIELDASLIERAVPVFKELGLTQDQAQKLVDFHASEVQSVIQNQVESFDQLKQDWLTEVKQDKEIGGDALDQAVQHGRAALGRFGTPELTKLLNDFGIGNHPEMIRFMAKVGKLTQEDNPGNPGGLTGEKKDRVSILYPNS